MSLCGFCYAAGKFATTAKTKTDDSRIEMSRDWGSWDRVHGSFWNWEWDSEIEIEFMAHFQIEIETEKFEIELMTQLEIEIELMAQFQIDIEFRTQFELRLRLSSWLKLNQNWRISNQA